MRPLAAWSMRQWTETSAAAVTAARDYGGMVATGSLALEERTTRRHLTLDQVMLL